MIDGRCRLLWGELWENLSNWCPPSHRLALLALALSNVGDQHGASGLIHEKITSGSSSNKVYISEMASNIILATNIEIIYIIGAAKLQ